MQYEVLRTIPGDRPIEGGTFVDQAEAESWPNFKTLLSRRFLRVSTKLTHAKIMRPFDQYEHKDIGRVVNVSKWTNTRHLIAHRFIQYTDPPRRKRGKKKGVKGATK